MAEVSPWWPQMGLQRAGMWRRWQQSVTLRPATMQRVIEGSIEKHSCTMLMLW
jgi:hypothetical protein